MTSTTSLHTMLLSLPSLEGSSEMTADRLRPVLSFNIEELVATVATLWNTVRSQGMFLEHVEKEMAKRKTEVEIKLRNLGNEVAEQVNSEARKRQIDSDRFRADIGALRDDVASTKEGVLSRCKSLEDDTNKKMEKTQLSVRMSMNEMNTKMGTLRDDITSHNSRLNEVSQKLDRHELDSNATTARLGRDLDALYLLFSVTKDDVVQANGTTRQRELLYTASPAFKTLVQRDRDTDEALAVVKRDVTETKVGLEHFAARVNEINDTITEVKNDLGTVIKVQAEQSTARDTALGERIDGLSRILGRERGGSTDEYRRLEAYVGAIDATIKSLQAEMSRLMDELNAKADSGYVNQKADDTFVKSAVDELQTRINGLGSLLDNCREKLESDIQNVASSNSARDPAMPMPQPSAPTTTTINRVDSGLRRGVSALGEDLATLQQRLNQHDDDIMALDRDKIGRQELEECLASALESIGSLQSGAAAAAPSGDGDPATSLRFRCLSCNRAAGPLVEKVRERLTGQQFPPSGLFLRGEGTAAPRRHQSPPVTLPGARELQPQNTTRRKLLNYYDWLKSREEEGRAPPAIGQGPAGQELVVVEVKSPRRVSIAEPHAIGTDGRYYVGVNDRPSSAPPN